MPLFKKSLLTTSTTKDKSTSINFTGTGVTVTISGDTANVAIPSIGGGSYAEPMRFYFNTESLKKTTSYTGASEVYDTGWTSPSFLRGGIMSPYKGTEASVVQTNASVFSGSGATDTWSGSSPFMTAYWVSSTLMAQTISGSVTGQIMVNQTGTTLDQIWTKIKVVDGVTGATKATLLTLGSYAPNSVFLGTGYQNHYIFPTIGQALTNYTCIDGDRLAIEIGWGSSSSTASFTAKAKWGDGPTDLTIDETYGDASSMTVQSVLGSMLYALWTSNYVPSTGIWTEDVAGDSVGNNTTANRPVSTGTTPGGAVVINCTTGNGLDDSYGSHSGMANLGTIPVIGTGQRMCFGIFKMPTVTTNNYEILGAGSDTFIGISGFASGLFTFSDSTSSNWYSDVVVADGRWHSFIVLCDETSSSTRMYIDGSLQTTVSTGTTLSTASLSVAGNFHMVYSDIGSFGYIGIAYTATTFGSTVLTNLTTALNLVINGNGRAPWIEFSNGVNFNDAPDPSSIFTTSLVRWLLNTYDTTNQKYSANVAGTGDGYSYSAVTLFGTAMPSGKNGALLNSTNQTFIMLDQSQTSTSFNDLTLKTGYTVWGFFNCTGTTAAVQHVVNLRNGAVDQGLTITATGLLNWKGTDSGSHTATAVYSFNVSDSQWRYFIGTVDSVTGICNIYIDGNLSGTATMATPTGTILSPGFMTIGGIPASTATTITVPATRTFLGSITNVGLINRIPTGIELIKLIQYLDAYKTGTASTLAKNILYYNSGVFGQAFSSQIDLADGVLTLPWNSNPITATVSTSATMLVTDAARSQLSSTDSFGFPYQLQSFYGTNKGYWTAYGGSTVSPIAWGIDAPTTLGTATTRATASTRLFTSMRRIGYVTPATVSSVASLYSTSNQYWLGNAAGLGGFHFVARFGIADTVATAGMFCGLMTYPGSTPTYVAAGTNTDPNNFQNCIGVGQIRGTTVYSIMWNNTNTTTYSIPLTTLFAANSASTIMIELDMYAPPNATNIYIKVRSLGTTNEINTVLNTAGGQLPSSTTFMAPMFYRTNAATATAAQLDFVSMNIETDY